MAEYTGGRIVPTHGGVWNKTREYEELTIVLNEATGDSYISKRPVPAGTEIYEEHYWVLYSQYNEQITRAEDHLNDTARAIRSEMNEQARTVNQRMADAEQNVEDRASAAEENTDKRAAAAEKVSNDNKTALESRMANIEARQEANVRASTDSSADYAAEVVDARVDEAGKTHASLGEAVRSIMPQVKDGFHKLGLLEQVRCEREAKDEAVYFTYYIPIELKTGEYVVTVDGVVSDTTIRKFAFMAARNLDGVDTVKFLKTPVQDGDKNFIQITEEEAEKICYLAVYGVTAEAFDFTISVLGGYVEEIVSNTREIEATKKDIESLNNNGIGIVAETSFSRAALEEENRYVTYVPVTLTAGKYAVKVTGDVIGRGTTLRMMAARNLDVVDTVISISSDVKSGVLYTANVSEEAAERIVYLAFSAITEESVDITVTLLRDDSSLVRLESLEKAEETVKNRITVVEESIPQMEEELLHQDWRIGWCEAKLSEIIPIEMSRSGGAKAREGYPIAIGEATYWRNGDVEVTPGDLLYVKTHVTWHSYPEPYVVFTDADDIVLQQACRNTSVEGFRSYIVTVPEGAAKLYLNCAAYNTTIEEKAAECLVGKFRYYYGIQDQIVTNRTAISGLGERVTALEAENTDKLPDYYYVDDWLDTRIQQVKENTKVTSGMSFAFITDIHVPSNQMNSKYMLKEILAKTSIDIVFFGGDIPYAYGTKEYMLDACEKWVEYRNAITRRFFYIRGNHDFTTKTSKDETTGYTAQNNYAYDYIMRGVEDMVHSEPGKMYFYVDYPLQKIRFICIDSFEKVGEEDAPWSLRTFISTEQYNWLLNDALAVQDYTFVVFSHIPSDDTLSSYASVMYPVHQIEKALNSRGTYAFQNDGSPVSADFTGCTSVVACHISGHCHGDYSNTDDNVLTITTTCDAAYNDDPAVRRTRGTVTEQAFDVFSVDTAKREIKTVRFGAGENRAWNY